jgi:hypothetical protein
MVGCPWSVVSCRSSLVTGCWDLSVPGANASRGSRRYESYPKALYLELLDIARTKAYFPLPLSSGPRRGYSDADRGRSDRQTAAACVERTLARVGPRPTEVFCCSKSVSVRHSWFAPSNLHFHDVGKVTDIALPTVSTDAPQILGRATRHDHPGECRRPPLDHKAQRGIN